MASAKSTNLRYSVPMLLLLTACLLAAEHVLPQQAHGNIDLDFILSKQSGRLPRQVAYIVMGFLGVAGILKARRDRRVLWQTNRLAVVFVLLLGWSALSLFWTDTPEITAKRLFVLALMFVGAFGLVLSWTRTEILKLIALSSALQVFVGLGAEIAYGYFMPFDSSYRFAGTLPWNSQGYLCLVMTLASICVAKSSVPQRWLYQMLAGCGFVMLLLTRSRGALLALTMAIALVVMVSTNVKQKAVAASLSCAVVFIVLLLGMGNGLLSVLNRGGEGGQDFTGRAPLWEELMTYVDRRPWLGYGYEGFWTEKRIAAVSGDQRWAIDTAHSGYIENLLGLGVVGVLLHTLMLLGVITAGVRLFRATGDYAFLLAATLCSAYLVGGFLEALSIVKTSQSSFYLALMLCLTVRAAGRTSATSASSGDSSLPAMAMEAVT